MGGNDGQPGDGGGQVSSGAQVGGGRRRVGSQAPAVGRSVVARRWVAAAGSRAVTRRWAAVGSYGSPHMGRDKVVVVVLSLCGCGYQNGTCQRANLLRSMLGRSRLLCWVVVDYYNLLWSHMGHSNL
jgi:hypothetical protein